MGADLGEDGEPAFREQAAKDVRLPPVSSKGNAGMMRSGAAACHLLTSSSGQTSLPDVVPFDPVERRLEESLVASWRRQRPRA